jgi:hypothetical protein
MGIPGKNQHGAEDTGLMEPQPPADYIELLERIHRHLLPRTYAEIGVSSGRSLGLSLPGTRAVGVDPQPLITFRLPLSAKVVRLTSDDFFRRYKSKDLFGKTPLDLAFIDGMHLFEFALRDFMNLEKWCTPDSVILIHDCHPINELSAARVRSTKAWTGDVWKLVLCLKEFRPDLNVSTVGVPPSGLCVITGLDPASRVLETRYNEICERFIDLDYSVIAERTDGLLNAVANDWAVVRGLLPDQQFRAAEVGPLELLRSLRLPPRVVVVRRIRRLLPAPVVRRLPRPFSEPVKEFPD